jgi:hypothetical protein
LLIADERERFNVSAWLRERCGPAVAAVGPFKPYSPDEMRMICERIVREKRRP